MRLDDENMYTISDMVKDLIHKCFELHSESKEYDQYLKYALLLYGDIEWS